MNKDLDVFLNKYNIPFEGFSQTGLSWEDLMLIREDYHRTKYELQLIARYVEDKLQNQASVHLVRRRLKHAEHLLAKVIRKRIEYPERKISVDNYREEITDLIGIRAIHLFKEDWIYVHEYLEKNWNLHEKPTAYIRRGDSGSHVDEFKKRNFNIEVHPYGYRSLHYLIDCQPSKDLCIAEIQVRTIFEEGWSEIDHTIKYPKVVADPLLDTFLDNFNILAGNSDQMGSFVRNLKNDLLAGTQKLEMYEKLTQEHTITIDSLKKRVEGTIGELNSRLRTVENKVQTLLSKGAEVSVFEKSLRHVRSNVRKFETKLSRDPQTATEYFELAALRLEQLDKLLTILLDKHERATVETNGDSLSSYHPHLVQLYSNIEVIASIDAGVEKAVMNTFKLDENRCLQVESAVQRVMDRSQLTKLMIGPNYRALRKLRREVVLNNERVQTLTEVAKRVSDKATRSVLQEQTERLDQQNKALESFVVNHGSGFTMFGWLVRLIV